MRDFGLTTGVEGAAGKALSPPTYVLRLGKFYSYLISWASTEGTIGTKALIASES